MSCIIKQYYNVILLMSFRYPSDTGQETRIELELWVEKNRLHIEFTFHNRKYMIPDSFKNRDRFTYGNFYLLKH